MARYEFRGPDGELLFWKNRYEPKKFEYRHWSPSGRSVRPWKPGTRDNDAIDADEYVYNLPEVLAGIRAGRWVWWCEGEKDANTVATLGKVSTSQHGGAGAIFHEMGQWFEGAKVVVVLDNDLPGFYDAWLRYSILKNVGARVSFRVPVNPYKDVTDHIEAGFKLRDLRKITAAEVWQEARKFNESHARKAGY